VSSRHDPDDDSGEGGVFSDDAERPTSTGNAHVTMVGGMDLKSIEASTALYRLHVVGARATQSFFLEEGEHIIGRSSDASVRVDEDSMSRKHARLVVVGDRISLTDLGSMNGSRVRERAIKPGGSVDVAVGESFELGSVMFVLQRRKHAEKPRRRVYDHGYLETRVDEEIARRAARRTAGSDDSGATLRVSVGGGLTLCRLHLSTRDGSDLDDVFVEEVLEEELPAAALVAEYAPGELEVLFLDEEWADVEAACAALADRFGAMKVDVRTGFAIFPRDGRTASSLLSVANSRVQSPAGFERGGAEVPALVVAPQQDSGSMDRLTKLVERVAPSDISIVIHGETGVGKEVMARQIHNLSHRAGKPFVGLNCAALTETLLESELFGHERGAFSGAVNTKPGLFEVADKGTVFLDEIGEMSPAIQAKLLRVLEERTVLRVGGLSPRSIDVRFLAASHKDLEVEAGDGRFRQDLYFRLNGITLEIPPLRERIGELEGLMTTFITDVCRRSRRTDVPSVGKEALALLKGYSWPGNIRELRNIIERAVILCTGTRITAEHLPVERLQKKQHPLASRPSSSSSPLRPAGVQPRPARAIVSQPPIHDDEDFGDENSGTSTRPALRRPTLPTGLPTDDSQTMPPLRRPQGDSLKDAVSDLERERIIDALKQCGGNQTKAAELLGISRRTLLNRLDQYNLPRPRK
jgi:DNA-binding NtrC family response regulator